MGMKNMRLGLFLIISISLHTVSFSMAAMYKVGDSAGWTVSQNIDYNHWAANYNFYVGDTLLFEYSPQYHNVMMVSYGDYESCNTTFPIKTYNSGHDSITLQNSGHFFFICGFPGHCLAGQKFHLQVNTA